jgi:hypothetical protein
MVRKQQGWETAPPLFERYGREESMDTGGAQTVLYVIPTFENR